MVRKTVQIDVKTIIRQVREAGFSLELDDADKPTVSPLNRLTTDQKAMLKAHREAIQKELIRERAELPWLDPWSKGTVFERHLPNGIAVDLNLLTHDEQVEYFRLCDWFLDWQPPENSYVLNSAVKITDPQKNHSYYATRIREGCRGQIQRSILDHLRKHWMLFLEDVENE